MLLKYLLDTSIVIYAIRNRSKEVFDIFSRNVGKMAVSCITEAELCYGVEQSQKPIENGRIVEDFLSRLTLLPYDRKAANHFGDIKSDLTRRAVIVGENEIHIAAQARSQGLILVTNNLEKFRYIEGLRLENWVDSAS